MALVTSVHDKSNMTSETKIVVYGRGVKLLDPSFGK